MEFKIDFCVAKYVTEYLQYRNLESYADFLGTKNILTKIFNHYTWKGYTHIKNNLSCPLGILIQVSVSHGTLS